MTDMELISLAEQDNGVWVTTLPALYVSRQPAVDENQSLGEILRRQTGSF